MAQTMYKNNMMCIVEIRSAAGGEHSKKLVETQFSIYYKFATAN